MVTFRDYLWTDDDRYSWWIGNGYVVSLIRDTNAAEMLDALRAFPGCRRGVGLGGFGERAGEFESLGLVEPMAMCAQTVGVADVGDGWALLIQANSEYLGVSSELLASIIESHEVIGHSQDINAHSRFVWWRDGQQQISFDTLIPSWDLDRAEESPTPGTTEVLRLISEVGGIERDTEGSRTDFFHIPGSFALAEALTGVAVTKETLETAVFTVAIVPVVPDDRCEVSHELPPREPLTGAEASWSDVVRLNRSSVGSNVHGTFTQVDQQETYVEEIWRTPFGAVRQVDAEGLVSVTNRRGEHWHRGPYSPQTNIDWFVNIGHRWDGRLDGLIAPTSPGNKVEVSGRMAWEFDLPPGWDGMPIAVAFDAETGVVVRAQTPQRTEALALIDVDKIFDDALFVVPG